MKPLHLLALLCVLLSGCSDEKKLMRILARSPELRDTVVVHDTITAIVEYVHRDTVWKVTKDTLVLHKDRLTVRTVVRNDTIWQDGECAADTVVKVIEHRVPIIQPAVTRDHIPWGVWLIVAAALGIAILALLRK